MTRYQETIWCDACGVEILWAPLTVEKRDFCCRDCFEDQPCKCSERAELEERRRARSDAGRTTEWGGP